MDEEGDIGEVVRMEQVRGKGVLSIPGEILERTFHEDQQQIEATTYHDVTVGAYIAIA